MISLSAIIDANENIRALRVLVLALTWEVARGVARVAIVVLLERVEVGLRARRVRVPDVLVLVHLLLHAPHLAVVLAGAHVAHDLRLARRRRRQEGRRRREDESEEE